MVLNYKYYEMDLKTLYVNKAYLSKAHSDKTLLREGMMRNVLYEDYGETSVATNTTDIPVRSVVPAQIRDTEVIFVRKSTKWDRFCRFWRNVFSFKFCKRM